MLERLKRFLLYLAIVLASIGSLVLVFSLWYRARDHKQRLRTQHSPLASVEERIISVSGGYKEIAFALTDKLGRVTKGRLRLPADKEGPFAALLILGGHGTGAGAVDLVRITEPLVLCGMDYPSYPEGKIRLYKIPGLLYSFHNGAFASVGMAATVLEYLFSRPEVDRERISVLGASFGVPFAIIAAALEPRLSGTVLIHGSGDLENLIDWNLRGEIIFGPLRRTTSYVLGTITAPFEPENYIGLVAPRPLLMLNSREDQRIPYRSIEQLFRMAGEPKELIWLDSGHIHPSNRKLIDSMTREVSQWLRKKGLL